MARRPISNKRTIEETDDLSRELFKKFLEYDRDDKGKWVEIEVWYLKRLDEIRQQAQIEILQATMSETIEERFTRIQTMQAKPLAVVATSQACEAQDQSTGKVNETETSSS